MIFVGIGLKSLCSITQSGLALCGTDTNTRNEITTRTADGVAETFAYDVAGNLIFDDSGAPGKLPNR